VDLYLLDRDETLLVETQQVLSDAVNLPPEKLLLCDVQDEVEVSNIMRDVRPDIVIHAAALKHVTFLERYPVQAMRVNIGGTRNVLESAQACGAHLFVNISTDKAASASNVLGATKKIAERLVANYNCETFTCVSVRFGNVLGSRGSLLPLVEYRLRNQLPVFITSRTATRYFMSIQEAVYLVLRGAVAAHGGKVLILEMGKALNIYDLVTRLAQILGSSSPIVVTELGPGERESELLYSQSEKVEATEVPGVMQLQSPTLSTVPEELFDPRRFSLNLLQQLINM
jgi:dTDP-glucose 4,6-dehydratase